MNIGFTGTRRGMTPVQRTYVRGLLSGFRTDHGPLCVHHGDCVGADAEFNKIADEVGCGIFIHPPTEPKDRAFCQPYMHVFPERPYLVRNRHIVFSTSVLIATPGESNEVVRSGTWSTIRYARLLGRRTIIVYPLGTVQETQP